MSPLLPARALAVLLAPARDSPPADFRVSACDLAGRGPPAWRAEGTLLKLWRMLLQAMGPVADVAALRLATGSMVAENLWHVERFVPGPTPDLRTTWCVAYDLDVASAGHLCSRTVARFPANGYGARVPGMMISALHRKARPHRLFFLFHLDIQT